MPRCCGCIVSNATLLYVAGYLALCREDAGQREHSLRAAFNGLRYIARTGNQWRFMPGDLPPWPIVYGELHWVEPAKASGGKLTQCDCAHDKFVHREHEREQKSKATEQGHGFPDSSRRTMVLQFVKRKNSPE